MADDMYRFGKKNTNEPKPKKPEEIKQEKFDKIVKDVADMDAEIEKLRQVIKAQSKVQYDYLNKLAAEINASDELPESDKAKLTQTALDAKIKEFKAPMPGRVIAIQVKAGQEVKVGDALLSLEAMKMENTLKAEGQGIVKLVFIKEGSVVEKGAILIEFE